VSVLPGSAASSLIFSPTVGAANAKKWTKLETFHRYHDSYRPYGLTVLATVEGEYVGKEFDICLKNTLRMALISQWHSVKIDNMIMHILGSDFDTTWQDTLLDEGDCMMREFRINFHLSSNIPLGLFCCQT